jgi:hypothetical protein
MGPLCGAALALGLTACPAKPNDPKTPGRAVEPRDTAIEHEPCDLKSSGARERTAIEGGPRVIQVFEGDREVCRAVDLNGDNTIDSFRYFDDGGKTRRRESGFDRDSLPDQISYFENGVVVRRERETNNDRKIDTWDYYENGQLARSERDSTGDGFIDQWWVFNRPGDEDCALVTSDADGDGKPDADSEIDICADKVPAKPPPAPTDEGEGGGKPSGGEAPSAGEDPGEAQGDEEAAPAEDQPETPEGP